MRIATRDAHFLILSAASPTRPSPSCRVPTVVSIAPPCTSAHSPYLLILCQSPRLMASSSMRLQYSNSFVAQASILCPVHRSTLLTLSPSSFHQTRLQASTAARSAPPCSMVPSKWLLSPLQDAFTLLTPSHHLTYILLVCAIP